MKKLYELPRDEVERIFNTCPFVSSLGIKLVSIGPGKCETELLVQPHHLQQNGFIHGGVQASLADHSAGGAAATLAEANQLVLTAEYKINLLRPARGEKLSCVATVLKRGSRLTVVESEVYSDHEGAQQLVSKATFSIAIVEKNG